MRFRFFAFVSYALCLSPCAFASFDMMLYPSQAIGRVNRYDPVNNINLGSFVSGGNSRVISIDQGSNHAFVFDGANSRLKKLNYNTGLLAAPNLSISNVTGIDYHAATDRLWGITSTSVFYWTQVSTSIVQPTDTPGVTWSSSFVNGNIFTAIGRSTTNELVSQSFNTTTGLSIGVFNSGIILASGSSIGKAASVPSFTFGQNYVVFSYADSAGVLRLGRFIVDTNGLLETFFGSQDLTGIFSRTSVMPAAVNGHESFFLVGQDSVTSTLLRSSQYDTAGPFIVMQSNTITTTFSSGAFQVANVVAPEPGTMIAIGLGLAALAKRRAKITIS